MPEVIIEAIVDFIYKKIYYNFNALTELFLDNKINFIFKIIIYLIIKFAI